MNIYRYFSSITVSLSILLLTHRISHSILGSFWFEVFGGEGRGESIFNLIYLVQFYIKTQNYSYLNFKGKKVN